MKKSKTEELELISKKISCCKKCSLYKNALNSVPGDGNPDADIFIIGEAPGAKEDQQGLPFVGASGKLLNKLLLSINLDRSEVFIANILKHRPPENRDPHPDEISVCTPYLKSQLEIIKPKVVITLGRFAMNYFFPSLLIGDIHGKINKITWQGLDLVIIPAYHPSAAMRNGKMLASLQADFKVIGEYLKN